MKLTVVQTGRLRDHLVIALCDEYRKRFGRFGTLTAQEKTPRGATPLWPASTRWKVLLDERGDRPDSEGLAKLLGKWSMAHGEIAFLVGDAHGHHAPSAAAANVRLSLGPLTLPHQLAHLILVEQLYRAATILAGMPYHHGG